MRIEQKAKKKSISQIVWSFCIDYPPLVYDAKYQVNDSDHLINIFKNI